MFQRRKEGHWVSSETAVSPDLPTSHLSPANRLGQLQRTCPSCGALCTSPPSLPGPTWPSVATTTAFAAVQCKQAQRTLHHALSIDPIDVRPWCTVASDRSYKQYGCYGLNTDEGSGPRQDAAQVRAVLAHAERSNTMRTDVPSSRRVPAHEHCCAIIILTLRATTCVHFVSVGCSVLHRAVPCATALADLPALPSTIYLAVQSISPCSLESIPSRKPIEESPSSTVMAANSLTGTVPNLAIHLWICGTCSYPLILSKDVQVRPVLAR